MRHSRLGQIPDLVLRSVVSVENATRWAVTFKFHSIYFDFLPFPDKISTDLQDIVDNGVINGCDNRLTHWSDTPSGFGVPYDVLSPRNQNQLVVRVFCQADEVSLQVGTGQATQYVYRRAYLWNAGAWREFELTTSGSGGTVGEWIVGSATAHLRLSSEALDEDTFVVAYVCTWTGTEWKCGCRDASCQQSFWQLQAFRRDGEASALAVAGR